MGLLGRLLAPRGPEGPAQGFQILAFAPAVARISIAGKEATAELDALGAAVTKLRYPQGVPRARVFAAASELTRMIRIAGVPGLIERMKAELGAEARVDAMQLALTAVFCSPQRDSGDIGILAGLAADLGIGAAEFEMLCEDARALA